MTKKVSPLQKALNVWAIVIIIWSIYRAYFKTDLPLWFDEFIAKPLVFILPIFYYITRFEKNNFFSGIDLKTKKILQNIIIGVVIGLIFFVGAGLGNFFKSKDSIVLFSKLPSYKTIFYYLLIVLSTAISEEILSRGFILKRLYADYKNVFTSSFFASILFFFMHIPIIFTNDRIVGMVLLRVMITDFVLSLAVSFIYLERKSLIPPIIIHAFYNLSFLLFI